MSSCSSSLTRGRSTSPQWGEVSTPGQDSPTKCCHKSCFHVISLLYCAVGNMRYCLHCSLVEQRRLVAYKEVSCTSGKFI